ncbi:PilZ domain-containing protein [Vibrio sp. S4M6]|uniref:PilZ domain-containing protein n=1 Tax=Vibrio sinus TaxID=2946865 RepID=UPI00202A8E01|nr:PilZ domain-containing protein [Vibrio sinus]MCL9782303.1 PilZ domain-containing protein [Vibrio sinus]
MAGQEYFSVNHSMVVNIEPLSSDYTLPTTSDFESEIPHSFIIASQFSQLDQLNDKAMLELKHGDLSHVIELLDHQNSKLNLILTYMLSQQDEQQYRQRTISFGASQFLYQSPSALTLGAHARVKLFLEHPAAAIYCYTKVVECAENDEGYAVSMEYVLLREQDRDLLIKAALHQQQKLLRERTLNRE